MSGVDGVSGTSAIGDGGGAPPGPEPLDAAYGADGSAVVRFDGQAVRFLGSFWTTKVGAGRDGEDEGDVVYDGTGAASLHLRDAKPGDRFEVNLLSHDAPGFMRFSFTMPPAAAARPTPAPTAGPAAPAGPSDPAAIAAAAPVARPATSARASDLVDGTLRRDAATYVYARSPTLGPASDAQFQAMPWLDPNVAPIFDDGRVRASAELFADGAACVRVEGWDGKGRVELDVAGQAPALLGPLSYDAGRKVGAIYLTKEQAAALDLRPGRSLALAVRGSGGDLVADDDGFELEPVTWNADGVQGARGPVGRADGKPMDRRGEYSGQPLTPAQAFGEEPIKTGGAESPGGAGLASRGPVVTSYVDLIGYRIAFFTRELGLISLPDGIDRSNLRQALAQLGAQAEEALALRAAAESRPEPIWRSGQSVFTAIGNALTPRPDESTDESGARLADLQQRATDLSARVDATIRRARTILRT
jgi:hypothetical protein